MFEEAQSYWQNLSPENHSHIKYGGIALAALVVGHILGSMAARVLRSRNFDAALRLPGGNTPSADTGITPTFLAGWLVRLSIWGWAAGWLATQYGWADVAPTVGPILRRTWALVGVLVVILGLGSMLAHRLVDFFDGWRATPDPMGHRNGVAAPRGSAAGAVAAAVYVVVTLVVLLIAADMFDWPLTRTSTQALWQFAQKLLIASCSLLIGLFAARWARDLVSEPASTPEKRAGQYTALGMVAIATLLALGTLLSSAGVLVGLIGLAIFGLCLWLARGYLPDVAAGLQLRTNKIREVWFDGAPWQVADVGFLQSHISRDGAVHCMQNRLLLDARHNGEARQVAAR